MSIPADLRVLQVLKLPRKVEEDSRRIDIEDILKSNFKPIWPNSPYQIA